MHLLFFRLYGLGAYKVVFFAKALQYYTLCRARRAQPGLLLRSLNEVTIIDTK